MGTRRRSRALRPLLVLTALAPWAQAQSCISLAGSTTCPAFNTSSISTTDSFLLGVYPFLSFVTNLHDFDQQMNTYVKQDFVRAKYQNYLGCSNVTLTNTTAYYARYTMSTICNSLVQNSIKPCNLTPQQAPPLCADTCAQQATSEEQIAANKQLCGTPGSDFMAQIRADFTNCALPANALTGSCITGEANEPDACGFASNLGGLCGYCAASSPNATDSCCSASNVTHRCVGVTLPSVSSVPPLFPSSTAHPSASSTASATGAPAAAANHGLSAGAIAGIVVGTLVAAALLLGCLIMLCVCLRRRRGSQFSSPRPRKTSPVVANKAFDDKNTLQQPPPGGRIARMTALEGNPDEQPGGMDPMLAAEKRRYDQSDSDPYASTPSRGAAAPRRQGSLSSSSALGSAAAAGGVAAGALAHEDATSPSNHHYSSPGEVGSGQSEQLPYFRDYFSNDDIHPHDRVAALWAYTPRAADEFELERGDMIRVVGIWDDGWATGVLLPERADQYDGGVHQPQRDSGISTQDEGRKSPLESGEVRAFPLVCVTLLRHWRKAVEADGSSGSASPPARPDVERRRSGGPDFSGGRGSEGRDSGGENDSAAFRNF